MNVTPKTTLRLNGRICLPGREVKVPRALADRLQAAGLVETASLRSPERAVSVDKYHAGGGWYDINGRKVRGRDAALEALREEE